MPNYTVTETIERPTCTIEVVEWREFKGLTTPWNASLVYALRQGGFAARQVRIQLRNSTMVIESGALQFLAGTIEIENKMPSLGGMFGAAMSGENVFRPTYRGTGEIWLEPTFRHLIAFELSNEQIIVDRGMFLAAESTVKVEAEANRNVGAALFGGEGLVQTKLTGSGAIVLDSPVPEEELVKLTVRPGQKVQVDGNFAVLRSGSVRFSVQKSSKSWLGSATSGEGLLQTFEGDGEVWVAPTIPVYNGLNMPLPLA